MIDCSPFVLGFFAYQIDKRQQMLIDQNENLELLVADRSKEINRQKLFYQALMQNIPIAVVTLDKNHRVVSVNPAFTEMFGHRQEDIVGMELDPLLANPERPQEAEEITLSVLSGSRIHEFGKRKRKDGSLIDVEILGQPIFVNGSMTGVLGLYRDITAEKEAEAALRNSEERFRVMFSDSPVALRMEDYSEIKRWVDAVQKNGHTDIRAYLHSNPDEIRRLMALARITDLNNASLVLFHAKNKEEFQKYLHTILASGQEETAIDILASLQDGQTTLEREMEYQRLDGENIYAITKLSIVPGFEDTWEQVLFSNLDITDRKRAREHLEYISLHDMMTGVYNRTFFEEEMGRFEKSRQYPISILLADMDNLKSINDKHGHAAGDLALQQVSDILKNCFREEDVIARIGGDEFSVLLPGVDEVNANNSVLRIQQAIAESNSETLLPFKLQLSIGTATADKGSLLSDYLKMADEAMYADKQQHKKVN
jgi:diguanylate cyclase (GGDEF)-like protein/PAS domain S-box-containing protein